MNMDILAALPGFALAFILIFCYEYRIKLIKIKPKNNVHFYVARDNTNGELWLYIGKPIRANYEFICPNGKTLTPSKNFSKYGLDVKNYANLRWEDEPVEVFLNIKD